MKNQKSLQFHASIMSPVMLILCYAVDPESFKRLTDDKHFLVQLQYSSTTRSHLQHFIVLKQLSAVSTVPCQCWLLSSQTLISLKQNMIKCVPDSPNIKRSVYQKICFSLGDHYSATKLANYKMIILLEYFIIVYCPF